MLVADINGKVKESELYRLYQPFVSDEVSCNRLIDRIQAKAGHLSNLLAKKTPNGLEDLHSAGTTFLKFTQNLGVKLAAGHLSKDTYDVLSARLESRAVLSLFALERSQTYEALAVTWSHNVQGLSTDATSGDLLAAVRITQSDVDDLLNRAKAAIRGLRYGKTPGQTARIRLLLAIVNAQLHELDPRFHYELKDLLITSKKVRGVLHPGYDIEHVGASSTAELTLGELKDSVGNLTLFHSHDNRSQGNNDVEFKASDYGASRCYATKILTATPDADTSIERIIGQLRTNTVDDGYWTRDDVEDRLNFYLAQFENMCWTTLKSRPLINREGTADH